MILRHRQQGWVGLLVLLLALVVVGLLARTALKQYGVASGIDSGERTVKKLPPGASEVDQAAAVTPRNALERARRAGHGQARGGRPGTAYRRRDSQVAGSRVPRYPHPIIAREGWPHVAIALAVAVALSLSLWWPLAVAAWLVFAFVLQFFRDPPRDVPMQPNAVLSPADGRIVRIGKARDPHLDRDALLISVFMNVFNVHSNRSPVDAEVGEAWYHAGRFVNAALDKASVDNERNALKLVTPAGVEVTCVQIAGLIARRILCYVKPGDRLARGERYGFIRFGSRVDLYLPPDAIPRARVGDKVYATRTIVAELR